MIGLLLTVAAVVGAVTVLVVGCGRYLEWRAWDTDRRIERLRARGRQDQITLARRRDVGALYEREAVRRYIAALNEEHRKA